MGYNNLDTQQKALVSMSNGDVYTIGGTAAALIQDFLEEPELPNFLKITDIKSNREVFVATHKISSVVMMEAGDGRG